MFVLMTMFYNSSQLLLSKNILSQLLLSSSSLTNFLDAQTFKTNNGKYNVVCAIPTNSFFSILFACVIYILCALWHS